MGPQFLQNDCLPCSGSVGRPTPGRRCAGLLGLTLALVWGGAVPAQSGRLKASSAPLSAAHQTGAPGGYVGDGACRPCHVKESDSYAGTAHDLTSRPALAEAIAGSFAPGANVMKTANPSLTFRMTADADGFHQTAVDEVAPGKTVNLSEPIDIVVGSGRKAQTYLYWKSGNLFELPVSFWVKTGSWINSPGYVDGAIRFDRPIYPRCLECHANSFQSIAPPANHFDRASLSLGIGCERCHGPGGAHVAFYNAHPADPSAATDTHPAEAIVNPARLSRARNIDSCAICHAGLGKPLAPALSYVPGAALDRVLQIPPSDPSLPVDVHGNQVQLLQSSRCFRQSSMTCNTCHNVHEVQRDAASFSPVCLQCHQKQQCGEFHALGEAIATRCVECHMPLQQSNMLFSNTDDQTLQLPVRSHRIAVYPAAGKQAVGAHVSAYMGGG